MAGLKVIFFKFSYIFYSGGTKNTKLWTLLGVSGKPLNNLIWDRKPFLNSFFHCREFSLQSWYKKIRIFINFQLQTALESRKQHQMTWNLAYLSIFISSKRKNPLERNILTFPKIKVDVRFFSNLNHIAILKKKKLITAHLGC